MCIQDVASVWDMPLCLTDASKKINDHEIGSLSKWLFKPRAMTFWYDLYLSLQDGFLTSASQETGAFPSSRVWILIGVFQSSNSRFKVFFESFPQGMANILPRKSMRTRKMRAQTL